MDIARASIDLNQSKLMQQVQLIMVKKNMDQNKSDAANLINMMTNSTPPSFNHKLDIRI